MKRAYYGKSMYGGWYLSTTDGTVNAWTSTLKQLREEAKIWRIELAYRLDN